MLEQAGFPVFSALEMLYEHAESGKYSGMMVASPIDPHPGPAASWLIGRHAADVLEQNYASILGVKEDWDKSKLSIEVNDWLPWMLKPQPIREEGHVAEYIIRYPSQSAKGETVPGNIHLLDDFLRFPNFRKYVKLNFKYPVRLSSIKIASENLRAAEVYTLIIKEELGFDNRVPHSLGKRQGDYCVFEDGSEHFVTSLLISAATKKKAEAHLYIAVESDGGKEAFY